LFSHGALTGQPYDLLCSRSIFIVTHSSSSVCSPAAVLLIGSRPEFVAAISWCCRCRSEFIVARRYRRRGFSVPATGCLSDRTGPPPRAAAPVVCRRVPPQLGVCNPAFRVIRCDLSRDQSAQSDRSLPTWLSFPPAQLCAPLA
jgi:hypothetical protein